MVARHSAIALVIVYHNSFLRGLCAESDNYVLMLLDDCKVFFILLKDSNYEDQIPHKAACEFDYNLIQCWRHLLNDVQQLDLLVT